MLENIGKSYWLDKRQASLTKVALAWLFILTIEFEETW